MVLCDIGLPKLDGYEVAKAIRATAGLGSVRLVALSGHTMPSADGAGLGLVVALQAVATHGAVAEEIEPGPVARARLAPGAPGP